MFNTSLNNGGSEKVGSIKAFGGSVAPFGWLICDGSAVSRTLYAALFDVIGTTYGSGDGSTTFNIPNCANIVNSVNTSVPCKGNGIVLGLTDGSNYGGVTGTGGDNNLRVVTGAYGAAVHNGNYGQNAMSKGSFGITYDSAKSGIVGTVTRVITTCKFLIKY